MPNTGAREILITEITHFSAQNHAVALHLTIRSQALDICATLHCVSLIRLELLFPEASFLNGLRQSWTKRNLCKIWKAEALH